MHRDKGYINQRSQLEKSYNRNHKKDSKYSSSFIEPYHIIDSENQQDRKYYKKNDQNLSGNLNPENFLNKSSKTNENGTFIKNPNAPYISIKQIIQKQKIYSIKKKYYQTDNQISDKLQASVHQKLLQRAIQSSQKECQMIENMINQLLQEQKLIQKQLQEVQRKKRMLNRMTPEIYQMEKILQASVKKKLQRYTRNQKKYQTNFEQNATFKPSKFKKKPVSSFNKTLNLKQCLKVNQSKNFIQTKPNSPRSKVKDLNISKNGCQKSQGTTIRKKYNRIKNQKSQNQKKKVFSKKLKR